MDEQYEELVNGIILQAVRDYKKALKSLKKKPSNKDALAEKKEVEQFFLSEWFSALTAIDPISIMDKVKEEVGE